MRPPQNPAPFRIGPPAGFITGLIVGLLLGWVFHGVVGLFVRLGFALLLLVPLAIVVWFFFLRPRFTSREAGETGQVRVYTWGSGQAPRQPPVDTAPPPSQRSGPDDAIDVEFEELKRQVEDEGAPR